MAKVKIQPPPSNGEGLPVAGNATIEQPANGGNTLSVGVQNPSTVTSTTSDSTRGSLSNISASSIKRADNDDHDDDDDDDDSSAFDSSNSDTECDDDTIKRAIDRIPGALVPGEACITQNGALVLGPETFNPTLRALQTCAPPVAAGASSIGSIALQNSSDITFGNKTYIKGQVVIKNIYKDRQANGHANDAYEGQEKDATDHPSSVKKVPPEAASPAPRTWQASLKTIIKDKPLLSFIVMILLMIVLCAIIAVISILTASGKARLRPVVGDGDDNRANVPQDKDIEDDFFPDPKPLRLVTRTEWLAQPPRDELSDLKLPVNNIIIAHTATEGCTTQLKCGALVKSIQNQHINAQRFGDIGYNFLIGGEGSVFEGRGWHKVGAHLKDYNTISYGIAFIGNYETNDRPSEEQMEQLEALLRNCTAYPTLAADYKLFGAMQLKSTLSPGKFLMEKLRQHPHYSTEKP